MGLFTRDSSSRRIAARASGVVRRASGATTRANQRYGACGIAFAVCGDMLRNLALLAVLGCAGGYTSGTPGGGGSPSGGSDAGAMSSTDAASGTTSAFDCSAAGIAGYADALATKLGDALASWTGGSAQDDATLIVVAID